jgi:basic membrane protein A and related proteins
MRLLALGLLVALALVGCSSSGGDVASDREGEQEDAAGTGATVEASGEPVPEGETLTVGWILPAPSDESAVETVEQAFTGRLESVVASDSADPAAAASELAAQGARLVLSAVPGACAAIPDTHCVEPGGSGEPGENAVYLDDGWWNRAYLLGRAAGLVTETDSIGYVPAPETPEQTGAVNAFALGCQSANPNCIVRLPAAAAAAKAIRQLSNQGADVIASPLAGLPCDAAGNGTVQPVGSLGDPCGTAIVVADTASVLEPFVQAELEGSFAGGQRQALPLGDWAPSVPAEARTAVEESAAEIEGGMNVFTGPLFDNQGQEQVAEDEELTPEFVQGEWTWLLGGVLAP